MMDASELIHTVVQNVLEQLRLEKDCSATPCALIFAQRDEQLVANVQKELGESTNVVFWGEDMGNRTPCRRILPYLCCNAMAGLAMGKASGPVLREVLQCLLQGNEVEVLDFEYTTYAETAPGPLYDLYASYEKTLATYGLVGFRRNKPDTIRFREDLVTAQVVAQAQENGAKVLMIPATGKITPLAAEVAGNLHITILKRL